MDNIYNLARLVRRERQEQGKTIRELSQKTGVPPAVISRIENGHTADPRLSTVLALLGGLGVFLFMGERDHGEQVLAVSLLAEDEIPS